MEEGANVSNGTERPTANVYGIRVFHFRLIFSQELQEIIYRYNDFCIGARLKVIKALPFTPFPAFRIPMRKGPVLWGQRVAQYEMKKCRCHICGGNAGSRFSLSGAGAEKEPRIFTDLDSHPGAGNWRNDRDLQLNSRCASDPASLCRAGTACSSHGGASGQAVLLPRARGGPMG